MSYLKITVNRYTSGLKPSPIFCSFHCITQLHLFNMLKKKLKTIGKRQNWNMKSYSFVQRSSTFLQLESMTLSYSQENT